MRFGTDPRWALVRRVEASSVFRRSPRQRELLHLLCERALAAPSREIRTSEVIAAFARPALGDALEADNLVRVHVTRLRQRLAVYFAGDGASEPVVIEVPTPGCTPVFRVRWPPAVRRRRSGRTMSTVATIVLLVASVSLALRRVEPAPVDGESAAVGRLWTQMFGGRPRVRLVLGTVNADDGDGPWTSLADARVAQRIGAVAAVHGLTVEIVPAQEAGGTHMAGRDVIVTGPPPANPWLEPLEPRLGFRSFASGAGSAVVFEDLRADDLYRYRASEERGYCRVAWLPSVDGTASVLILSGTEAASTEAGLDFVTRRPWLERLRAHLGLEPADAYPYFEALLMTELHGSSPARFDLVAARTLAGTSGP